MWSCKFLTFIFRGHHDEETVSSLLWTPGALTDRAKEFIDMTVAAALSHEFL